MDFIWMPHFTVGWILPLLCLIFMVAMMIMMFRRGGCMPFGGGDRGPIRNDGETARRILDQRYASGQIGKEQYAEIRRDLD